MKCRIMQHFICVFTVCRSTRLPNTKFPKYKGIHCTRESRNFCQGVGGGGGGGVQVSLTKKVLTFFFVFFCFVFFSPQLILQKLNGQFQINLSFFKIPEGVHHFPGGVQLFPGGGGPIAYSL